VPGSVHAEAVSARLSPLERFLTLFTEVRPGEGVTAVLMFANVFLILCSYYFIKPLREGWISISDVIGLSKMEVRAYSSFLQSLLLWGVVTVYGRYTTRVSRGALVTGASLFCLVNLLAFWTVYPGVFFKGLPYTGVVFYLWVGMFGVFVVAQFWAFAADVYDDERGRRMMPLIAIGATAGAAGGSAMAQFLSDWSMVGTKHLLLAATVPLGAAIALTRVVDRREPQPPPPALRAGPDLRRRTSGAVRLVLNSRFLLSVAAITLLLNWVNTNGENLLFRVVQQALAEDAARHGVAGLQAVQEYTSSGTTRFYGNFYFWVNVTALVLQAFFASRLLKYGGFGAILMMLPVIALASYTTMALLPVLAVVKLMKVAENSTDYSINNTARQVLWLPVSTEVKFKGKPTIDAMVVRIGDGLAALTAFVGTQIVVLATQTFFAFNVGLVLIWIVFAAIVVLEHRKLTAPQAGRVG
jgi:AAA family ATP:ADP antiporter